MTSLKDSSYDIDDDIIYYIKSLDVKRFKKCVEKTSVSDYTNNIDSDELFTLLLMKCIDIVIEITDNEELHECARALQRSTLHYILTCDEYAILYPMYSKLMDRAVEIIGIILDKSPNINIKDKNGHTFLIRLADNEIYYKIYEKLIGHPNIDINLISDDDQSALHIASKSIGQNMMNSDYNIDIVMPRYDEKLNLPSIFNLLYNHPNTDINIQDKFGYTILMYTINSSIYCDYNIFDKLLEHPNININVQNYFGKTILMQSMLNYLDEISNIRLQYTLDKKCEWAFDGEESRLRNHIAYDNTRDDRCYYFEICPIQFKEILKQPKLDINIQDKDGNTAIMLSILNKRFHAGFFMGIMNSEHAKNIDPNIKNNDGKDLYQLISEMSHTLQFLDSYLVFDVIESNKTVKQEFIGLYENLFKKD